MKHKISNFIVSVSLHKLNRREKWGSNPALLLSKKPLYPKKKLSLGSKRFMMSAKLMEAVRNAHEPD